MLFLNINVVDLFIFKKFIFQKIPTVFTNSSVISVRRILFLGGTLM